VSTPFRQSPHRPRLVPTTREAETSNDRRADHTGGEVDAAVYLANPEFTSAVVGNMMGQK
jgi:hypothetical protein